jgi:hypothetical protein
MIEYLRKTTIMRGYFIIYIVCCFLYSVYNWKILSHSEGWGIVYMVGLIAIGIIGLGIDFILSLIIKNKRILNILGILIILTFSIVLYDELKC